MPRSVHPSLRTLLTALAALTVASCSGSEASGPEYSAAQGRARAEGGGEPPTDDAEAIPHGPLPEGVTPLRYTIWMEVVPDRDRFRGRVDVQVRLDQARELIWMHGRGLNVTQAEVLPEGLEPVNATFEQLDDHGVAALRLAEPVEAGEVTISLTYDAPFDRQLKGLYRVDTGGASYAFTQFEATSARLAFPCFDEPRFKTPFELTLSVRGDHEAIANTTPADVREIGEMKEVRFTPTEPLPTYLVAMAVGPLDVVEHDPIPANDVRDRPIPFRGVAVRGQGERLAYALEHTAPLLASLEAYFGVAYPYDKLDIIAVPDFASGAMENAGAITFRETLLLLDPQRAPENQRRAFAYVMAHELAHQWFGNLVTMPWWDDIWLNEAFATWMGNKTVRDVHPEYQAHVGMVRSIHGAMRADSLVSARQIRQPIESNHDIRNAFDAITYRKGGGVLEMFERWLGEETFREGIREYVNRHRFGTATADDLLDALSQMAGQDVGTPFRTFLMQPGVPLLRAERSCGDDGNAMSVSQRRYLPVGSEGERDRTWQVPTCVRYGRGRSVEDTCELVTDAEARVDLGESCPDWVMPNADAAGYYRWSLPAEGVERLMEDGWARLSERERLSVADNLVAAFAADTVEAADVFEAFDRIARDDSRAVATAPTGLISWTREHVLEEDGRGEVEAWAERLYGRRARRLGWSARRRESGETGLLRADLLSFLAFTARSERVRREAARRGRAYIGYGGDGELHPDAVEPNLVGTALRVAVQEGDRAFFEALLEAVLASDDALFRSRGLRALASTHDSTLAQRALSLSLDARLRVNEVTDPLTTQLSMPETRGAAWDWMRDHFDEVFDRVATTRAGYAPWYVSGFCSTRRAEEVEAFFGERIEALPGGPRNLRGALEAIRLCAARVEAQRASAQAFFER
ncbi:MAG TPA: M1 family metallopeptidase [Sandaracinaceae bacterium LLY-WYZ-13_1]|nr:M1 family metallopeptidase [Sandaracinaceae bacterium LLY-WYZ-13_1]